MVQRDAELLAAIGARVAEMRVKRGISRNDLAHAMGLSDGTALYKYERGQRGFSVSQLSTVSDLLGVTIEWLVYGKERNERVHDKRPAGGTSFEPLDVIRFANVIGRPGRSEIAKWAEKFTLLDAPQPPDDLPQPILDLFSLGWLKNITNDDVRAMRRHIKDGGVTDPHDLVMAVMGARLQADGSDENMRALNEANRARMEHRGYKRLDEAEAPRPAQLTNEVVNDARPKHIKQRPRRRTRSRTDES